VVHAAVARFAGLTVQLFQVTDQSGRIHPGVVRAGDAMVATSAPDGLGSTLALLEAAVGGLDLNRWFDDVAARGAGRRVSWQALHDTGRDGTWQLAIPITPPEVWGCGVTYRRSADFREEGLGIYDRIYEADRPELFYKASASRSVGPHAAIGRRRDSKFTAAEPEVAIVVSDRGAILGYTVANDVSAWDIERDNPLYLPQSKIYTGCFSCGPAIVTPDDIAEPYALELTCKVERGGTIVFSGSASTAQLKRKFPELVTWLLQSNDVPTGTVLSTGTGIIQPIGVGLEPGDVVSIGCPELGTLRNPVAFV
jgi:2-dehydro-3-deoxy-D-arabinonate dehydratase